MLFENTYPGGNGDVVVQGSSQNWHHSEAEVPRNNSMISNTWTKFHNTETHSPLLALRDQGPLLH